MRHLLIAVCALWLATPAVAGLCPRFPDRASSAYNPVAKRITLPWRTDFPNSAPSTPHAWEAAGVRHDADWRTYIQAVLSEVKTSGVSIANNKITMPAASPWWITPWMDVGRTGRERLLGLTTERSPDPGDLSPTSGSGHLSLAIGWYNAEGAASLREVFADPCDPMVPTPSGGGRWTFRPNTATFKLLFTDAPQTEVSYLARAPTVLARVGSKNVTLRLIQMDVAVRDTRATQTSWVFGTFAWMGPRKGDGFFDNLVPVGLMWGNDPGRFANTLAGFAAISESQVNGDLAGKVWQENGTGWPQRPYAGFQGRLNGPADNWRSSCLACHASAQYPRDTRLGAPPRDVEANTPLTPDEIKTRFERYFVNVPSGHLIDPVADQQVPLKATPLDYSLQLQTAFRRICEACSAGDLTGKTPRICAAAIPGANCPAKTARPSARHKALMAPKGNLDEALPRQ